MKFYGVATAPIYFELYNRSTKLPGTMPVILGLTSDTVYCYMNDHAHSIVKKTVACLVDGRLSSRK